MKEELRSGLGGLCDALLDSYDIHRKIGDECCEQRGQNGDDRMADYGRVLTSISTRCARRRP